MKGVDILIRVIAIASKEEPELRVVTMRSEDQNPYRRFSYRLGVMDGVVFTGYVEEEAKIGAIDASIGLTLPSISDYAEVFSLYMTEAWARGKPVTTSAIGEMPYR